MGNKIDCPRCKERLRIFISLEEEPAVQTLVEKLEPLSQSAKFLMSIYSRMDAVHNEPLDRPYMKGLRELINKMKKGEVNE